MSDLWPDNFGTTDKKVPLSILTEQAQLLGKKTNNIVQGLVEKIEQQYWGYSRGFNYAFNIYGPVIEYRYELFQISHDLEFYPLMFHAGDDIEKTLQSMDVLRGVSRDAYDRFRPASEEEFLTLLRAVFSLQKTIRVIQAIIAQSQVR